MVEKSGCKKAIVHREGARAGVYDESRGLIPKSTLLGIGRRCNHTVAVSNPCIHHNVIVVFSQCGLGNAGRLVLNPACVSDQFSHLRAPFGGIRRQ